MFITDNSLIEVKICWRKIKNRYDAFTESEFKKLTIAEEIKKKYTPLTLKMMELTWELYNKLQEESFDEDVDGNKKWNFRKYKENRLKRVLKEWDAKDDKGVAIPVNEKNILHLSPTIAEAIIRAYDEISTLGDEEEKN
jgi:hypothetical protein